LILSPDHFMYESDGTYRWTPERVVSAWALTLKKVAENLPASRELVLLVGIPGAGKSTWLTRHKVPGTLYVDATFFNKVSRAPFIAEARRLGRPVKAVWVNTSLEVCLARNDLRPEDRKVPAEKMHGYHAALEADPPSLDEGFEQVVTVAS
jgi:predicted kinase